MSTLKTSPPNTGSLTHQSPGPEDRRCWPFLVLTIREMADIQLISPDVWWFYLGFSHFLPLFTKNPPWFLNESIPACSKKWNKTKISPIPMFPSHYPSCSGLSSRFPSFSPSGYAIIFRSSHIIPSSSRVFKRGNAQKDGKINPTNPTRLVALVRFSK